VCITFISICNNSHSPSFQDSIHAALLRQMENPDGKPTTITLHNLGLQRKWLCITSFAKRKRPGAKGHTLVVTHERRASSKSHCWIESRDGPSILMHCHIDSRKSYALLRYWERYHFGAQHSRNLSFYRVVIVATDIPHRKHSEIEGWMQKA
jgi:hypothetical protein